MKVGCVRFVEDGVRCFLRVMLGLFMCIGVFVYGDELVKLLFWVVLLELV